MALRCYNQHKYVTSNSLIPTNRRYEMKKVSDRRVADLWIEGRKERRITNRRKYERFVVDLPVSIERSNDG